MLEETYHRMFLKDKSSNLSYPLWLSTWNRRTEDFLSTSTCVVPKWMSKMIIHCQPLVVADKLRTIFIDRCINRRIPTLASDTDIFEK